MRFICLIILLFGGVLTWADNQMKLDSLKIQLNYAHANSDKIKTLWALSDYYWSDDIRLAIDYAAQALDLAKKSGDQRL